MLFRKMTEQRCCYCLHCTKLSNDQMLCVKKGVVSENGKCRKFTYDPCKRIPGKAKALDFSKYEHEDYSL